MRGAKCREMNLRESSDRRVTKERAGMAHAVRRQVLAALEDFDDQRACQLLRSRKWERHQLLRADVLHRAAANGCVNAMRYLISEVGVPVDALDDLRRTPICLAAREVRLEATELLLTLGADPNPGCTCDLHAALTRGGC